jgi:glucoamylase
VNTFTLSVCIAALVTGARFLPASAEGFVLELADYWNARMDDWTAVYDTTLARQHNIHGYYIRITPASAFNDDTTLSRVMIVKNRRHDPGLSPVDQIGVDFLQMVRYGLRDPNTPLIRDTVKLVDALLRKELPQGSCWYRYTGDGYGEHVNGAPFDGFGLGRPWPLLSGERGHYELVRGENALPYLKTMAAMAGQAGMMPEQVWDGDSIVKYDLKPGGPTGSAMPLAWTHAEYIKLACSILQGYPVDRPTPLWARYHGHIPQTHTWYWSPQTPIRWVPIQQRLAFCLSRPAIIHWRINDGPFHSLNSTKPGLDIHIVRLPKLPAEAERIQFRISGEDWKEQREYEILVSKPGIDTL